MDRRAICSCFLLHTFQYLCATTVGKYVATAVKPLPIRVSKSVDIEIDNPIVGALEKGQQAWVIEKIEIIPGSGAYRSLVALEPGGTPKGWVTSGKEGNDFLVTEQALWEADESRPSHLKMKFHFFSFQVAASTGYLGHA